jgi:hypothetical protein
MSTPTQNYANHPRFPALYTLSGLALAVAACMRGWLLVREPSLNNASLFLLCVALLGLGWSIRVGDITLQDRLIRAEMRLRLERLLGAQRRAEFENLELKQLIALRFASDAELPALFEEVQRGELRDPDAIKRKVREWQADHLRV